MKETAKRKTFYLYYTLELSGFGFKSVFTDSRASIQQEGENSCTFTVYSARETWPFRQIALFFRKVNLNPLWSDIESAVWKAERWVKS